jgi:hypothetical protein
VRPQQEQGRKAAGRRDRATTDSTQRLNPGPLGPRSRTSTARRFTQSRIPRQAGRRPVVRKARPGTEAGPVLRAIALRGGIAEVRAAPPRSCEPCPGANSRPAGQLTRRSSAMAALAAKGPPADRAVRAADQQLNSIDDDLVADLVGNSCPNIAGTRAITVATRRRQRRGDTGCERLVCSPLFRC